MFKYTPPWQVLCSSLEHENKRQSTLLCSPWNVQIPEEETILSYSHQPVTSSIPVGAEDHPSSRITMGSTPKRWVMKPLSPKLEKSDLRAILSPGSEPYSSETSWRHSRGGDSLAFSFDNISVGRVKSSVIVSSLNGKGNGDVVVHARQVAVCEEDSTSEDGLPSIPSSPSSSCSADCHVGFYSFVDDPGSPEAERNEAYMMSPERQTKLSTLKKKSGFKLQTYTDERRPEKLFQETNGDSNYQVTDTLAENEEEDKPDRMEIIRSQAPKNNLKEQWSSLENLDVSDSSQNLVEGFSLCYSPVSTKQPLMSKAEPGTIDNQQIDFNAALKQFLSMEHSKQNPFKNSSQQLPQSPKLRARSLSAGARVFTKEDSKNKNLKDDSRQIQDLWERPDEARIPTIKEEPEFKAEPDKVQSSLDLDLGLGSQGLGSTIDKSFPTMSPTLEMTSSSSLASMNETPIEREIRLAQEREEDLRRSRGIFRQDTTEMVEIRTKPILSQPSPQTKPIKDSNRMSLLIQREIERENRSTEPYKQKTLGDKNGTGALSDQMQNISLSPGARVPFTGKPITVEDTPITKSSITAQKNDVLKSEETLSLCCPHRHQDETVIPNNSNQNQPKKSRRLFTHADSLSTPTWRSNSEISSERPLKLNAPDMIRREIEEDLRREQELQELRETTSLSLSTDKDMKASGHTLPAIMTPKVSDQNNSIQTLLNSSYENVFENDAVQHEKSTQRTSQNHSYSRNVDSIPVTPTSIAGPSARLPSVSMMTAQPWSGLKSTSPAVLRAITNLPSSLLTETSSSSSQKGLTETLLEDFEERRIRQKLEESSYAGIQPVDDINNEVVEVTRVTRHKNTRAMRWEAGVYANEKDN
ncbi:uncharacterized protein misp [Trichomycterus rosablanca]|uniref:uncharacterized protein misp n=1 Tax=Trichomycterus rosablanca TaxID=2290929 RepID=UPI002F3584F8